MGKVNCIHLDTDADILELEGSSLHVVIGNWKVKLQPCVVLKGQKLTVSYFTVVEESHMGIAEGGSYEFRGYMCVDVEEESPTFTNDTVYLIFHSCER